jgi:hypothetical protein
LARGRKRCGWSIFQGLPLRLRQYRRVALGGYWQGCRTATQRRAQSKAIPGMTHLLA